MSVRMALAKLCACACGGAIVGGGAVHVADGSRARSGYTYKTTKRIVRRTTAVSSGGSAYGHAVGCAPGTGGGNGAGTSYGAPGTGGSRTTYCSRTGSRVRRVVTQTSTGGQPQVVVVTAQGTPIPLPPAFSGSGGFSGGGGGGGTDILICRS